MGEIVLAIVLGVTMTLTGCTKAGESTVSDYEQGGYFQEEQQQEKKEVDKPKATTPQPTKSASEQPTERKQDNTRIINQQQNNKSTKGADRVKNNSGKVKHNSDNRNTDEHKQDNQSTQQDTQENIKQDDELVCAICGYPIHNGYDSVVVGNALLHKSCYQHELDDNAKHDI